MTYDAKLEKKITIAGIKHINATRTLNTDINYMISNMGSQDVSIDCIMSAIASYCLISLILQKYLFLHFLRYSQNTSDLRNSSTIKQNQ